MIKFVIIMLASVFSIILVANIFPSFETATFTVASHTVRWMWVGLAGLVFAGYKAIG